MAKMTLPPMRFRFTEPDDVDAYGGDWTAYDEALLLRLPARDLIEIEKTIGMSVTSMIYRSHRDFIDATLAAMWVSRRLAGHTDDFAAFAPLVLLAEWELVKPEADADPPAEGSSSSTSEPTAA